MSPWQRALIGLACATALVLSTGCAKIAPPYTYDVSKPPRASEARKATDMVIVLDTRLEWAANPFASDQVEYPPFLEYVRFADALQADLATRWPDVKFSVAHSTRPEPDLAPHNGRSHVVVMSLRGMLTSSKYGNRGRTWHLTVLQAETTDKRLYSALMRAKFNADFTSCYMKQLVLSDNKPQCRQEIVAYVATLLQQAEVLP
jgi:hypothetical protein